MKNQTARNFVHSLKFICPWNNSSSINLFFSQECQSIMYLLIILARNSTTYIPPFRIMENDNHHIYW